MWPQRDQVTAPTFRLAAVRWEDRKIVRRIKDIQREGDLSIGKPELLRGVLSGHASRRIDEEHRLVYRVRNGDIEIVSCRFHDEKWQTRRTGGGSAFDRAGHQAADEPAAQQDVDQQGSAAT